MRAGPLSDSKIIALLNRYYVPVTSSNEYADEGGNGPADEKAERRRIYLDFYGRKLGTGDVHIYVVGPDGVGIGGLDSYSASLTDRVSEFLAKVAEQQHTEPGPPLVKPHPTSLPPVPERDSLVFHLVSRSLAGGSWHEFPSENWIVLSRSEWAQLLPTGAVAPQTKWEIPAPVARKLAEWIYPQNEEKTQQNRSRVDEASFRMTVVARQGSVARARIDGRVLLMHSFYPNGKAQDLAGSELIGYMDFDAVEGRIQRVRLATEKAIYVDTPFRTSLVSMSRETLEALGTLK